MNKNIFTILLAFQCLILLACATTTPEEEQNKSSIFSSTFHRILQLGDETYSSFNSTYQYIFRFYEFCGDWSTTSPDYYQTQMPLRLYQGETGLMVVNMTSLKTFDIILFESKYIDQQFIVVSFNFSRLFSDLGAQNKVTTIYNENITYFIGRNLFRNNIQENGTCELQEVTVQLYNGNTGEGFVPEVDPISNLRLEIEVKENKGCLFSFKSSEVLTCGQQMPLQPWIYLLLNVIKAFANLQGTSIQYNTGLVNKSLELQFILSFALNCYIYFLNVELAHFLAPTIFAVVPISLFSIALDYTVLLKSFEKCTVMSVALSCVILCTILLYMEEGVYWIAVPFIAIAVIDLIKVVNPNNLSKFSFSFYFGYLAPAFVLLIYLRLYPNSFARLSPKYGLVIVCAVSLVVGILCVQFGGYIQKIRVARRKEKYYVEMKDIPKKDICPICMNKLFGEKKDSENNLESPLLDNEAIDHENPDQEPQIPGRIIQTPCQHKFHERCLSQWLDRKAECPYCRLPIPELA